MEEVLHDLCVKSCETWDILNINGWAGFQKTSTVSRWFKPVTFRFPPVEGHDSPFKGSQKTIPQKATVADLPTYDRNLWAKKTRIPTVGSWIFFWWHKNTTTLLSFCWQFWELAHVSWDSFLLGLLFVYALLSSTLFYKIGTKYFGTAFWKLSQETFW